MESGQHRMLTAEREQRILQLLKANEVMTVSAISQRLGASEATVRRDLQSMHERGLLERIHGGATYKSERVSEPLFKDKESLNADAKTAIAVSALELIKDNDTIFIDGGSTLLKLVQLLDERRNLTVVTNSLMAAALLMESGHKLILTGGEFRAISRTLIGPLSAGVLNEIAVDAAFMGTLGFTVDDGMSTTDANEAFTKSLAMKRARKVVLLADRTKLGRNSFAKCANGNIDVLVTDGIDDEMRKKLEDKNISVIIAKRQ